MLFSSMFISIVYKIVAKQDGTGEGEFDEGEVLQGIESPPSTPDEPEASAEEEELSAVGRLASAQFGSEVDDVELTSPQDTSRELIPRRPEHVPRLDLSSLTDEVAVGSQGAVEPLKLKSRQSALATHCEPGEEGKKFLYTQLQESRAEILKLNQTVEDLEVSKDGLLQELEDSKTEVMELWQSLNEGMLQNHNMGSSLQDLRGQLHVAKADKVALQGALERSQAETADVQRRLDSANRRFAEVECAAMAATMENNRLSLQLEMERMEKSGQQGSSIMAVGGEGGSLEGPAQGSETLEVERTESEKGSRSAGPSPLDVEDGGAEVGLHYAIFKICLG
ncbi:hypothetical protein BSKO_08046 [Bryopsis sp. KO-2023]|nr:hypothetical protein BSKO_08046 [Bryopsis sp. KO-2023]